MQRTRRAITDALNGDIEQVDSAVRRALFAISTEMDEHAMVSQQEHEEIRKEIAGVRRLLLSTTVTFVIALATGLLNLLIN